MKDLATTTPVDAPQGSPVLSDEHWAQLAQARQRDTASRSADHPVNDDTPWIEAPADRHRLLAIIDTYDQSAKADAERLAAAQVRIGELERALRTVYHVFGPAGTGDGCDDETLRIAASALSRDPAVGSNHG